ncbi:MAG: hypothetical protein ACLP7P_14815 [Rhodomicrobium sp.]
MTLKLTAKLAALLLCTFPSPGVQAQSWQFNTQSAALKSGETVEITDLYSVINCKSVLTAPPEVTIMEGPPGVTATAEEAMVVPRFQQCAKPVKGAKLKLTAGTIDDQTNSLMTIRVRFKTKDGDREQVFNIKISLFP